MAITPRPRHFYRSVTFWLAVACVIHCGVERPPLPVFAGQGVPSTKKSRDENGRPNILVIMADDLGYADIGVHGGCEVPTPHIDALAKSGIRCTNAYVSAPYCSPSRAGFLTGKYQTRFGHEFNPHVGDEAKLGLPLDQRTIADFLKAAGYRTALIGKWHQGFSPEHHPQSRGFDEFFGFLVGGHNFLLHKEAVPRFGTAHSHDMIYRGRDVQTLDGYTTDLFTDEAIRFTSTSADRPWFLFQSFNAVHTPLEIAPHLESRIPDSVKDRARRGYLSLLLGLDDSIGRLLAHLDATNQRQNTLIFFLSDNGGAGRKPYLAFNTGVNTPLRGDKGQTLEGGIRVPFFVSWPARLAPATTYDQPLIALDILPTACEAAGAAIPHDIDGVSLLPQLTKRESDPPHPSLYWRFGPQKAIRQGDWKLVDWRDFDQSTSSGWELFNLREDIGETNNLAAEHPELAARLRGEWESWNQRNLEPAWRGSKTEDPPLPRSPESTDPPPM